MPGVLIENAVHASIDIDTHVIRTSALDHLQRPHYISHSLFFPLEDDANIDDLTDALNIGLSHTLARFPYLTGTIEIREGDRNRPNIYIPKNGTVTLTWKDYSTVEKVPSFLALREAGFPFSMLDGDLLSPVSWSELSYNKPVFKAQANLLSGGLALVLALSHVAGDVTTLANVLEVWSQYTSQAFDHHNIGMPSPCLAAFGDRLPLREGTKDVTVDMVPFLRAKETATGDKLMIAVPDSHTEPLKLDFEPTKPASIDGASPLTIWFIKKAALAQLKDELSELIDEVEYVSTNDVLSALLWSCITRARRLEAMDSRLGIPCDGRRKVVPNLPPDYAGNTIIGIHPRFPTRQLRSGSLQDLAQAAACIRKHVFATGNETFRDAIGLINNQDKPSDVEVSIDASHGPDVIINSWAKTRFLLQNWGGRLGQPEMCRRPGPEKQLWPFLDGFVAIEPQLQDGFQVVMVLAADTFEALKQDQLFSKYFTFVCQ